MAIRSLWARVLTFPKCIPKHIRLGFHPLPHSLKHVSIRFIHARRAHFTAHYCCWLPFMRPILLCYLSIHFLSCWRYDFAIHFDTLDTIYRVLFLFAVAALLIAWVEWCFFLIDWCVFVLFVQYRSIEHLIRAHFYACNDFQVTQMRNSIKLPHSLHYILCE